MALAATITPAETNTLAEISSQYLESLSLIERLHRLLLDVVKDEFERQGRIDINSVQALLLFNIGEEELTAGDLKARGYYQGSNVSYNLKKLVSGGYLNHERCNTDRRSVRISLTAKGAEISRAVAEIFERHSRNFAHARQIDLTSFHEMTRSMRFLEQFWRDQIRFIY